LRFNGGIRRWIIRGKEDKERENTREGYLFGLRNIFILEEGEKNWRGKGEGRMQLALCIFSASILCLLLGPRYDQFYESYYTLLPNVYMCFSSFEGGF
jgi:hypothetical protein